MTGSTALARLTRPVLARRRGAVALIGASILVAGVFQFVPPLVMGRFLGVLIRAAREGATAATRAELSWLFAAIAAGVLTILGFQYLANRCGTWLSTIISIDLRTRLHRALLGMAYRERLALDAGTLQTRILADTGAVEGFFAVALPTIAIQTIFVGGAVTLLALRVPFLAPLVALPLAILVIASLGLRRATARLIDESATRASALSARIAELGQGVRAIRLFGREPHQHERFSSAAEDAASVQRRLWAYAGGYQHLLILNVSLCSYLLWYVGGMAALGPHGAIAVNDLIALVPIVLLLFQPVYTLAAILDSVPKAFAAAERIAAVIDAPQETARGRATVPAGGALVFDNVRFSYVAGTEVLRGCSFTVHPGEFVALTGPSGAGKSTIVNLIARLYEPQAGSLCWGSLAAADVDPRAWRRAIGVVAQETFLFAESVRENIRCGRPWITDAAIEAAARIARADTFIAALPAGYDTMLGDGGGDLSGGQRQRIGIARALAGDPPLLVLDEPTAALDPETEAAFLDALVLARGNRTLIAIAHRPSTIERADRVLHLSDGSMHEIAAAVRC